MKVGKRWVLIILIRTQPAYGPPPIQPRTHSIRRSRDAAMAGHKAFQ